MRVTVYPEYYHGDILDESIEIFGRFTKRNTSEMYLCLDGEVKISYEKMRSDGKNREGCQSQKIEIYEKQNLAIGLVCCMDVNNPVLLQRVKCLLNESKCHHKIIAISALMSSDWFTTELLSPDLQGYIVALANGNPYGVKSFIAGTNGCKVQGGNYTEGKICINVKGCT